MAEMKSALTKERLLAHYARYPEMELEDLFKYVFHSACGCDHLVSSEEGALNYIKSEYASMTFGNECAVEELDGEYSRVYLSCLDGGMRAETLARMFYLSAKKEPDARERIEEKLKSARELIADGRLPFDIEKFDTAVGVWCENGYAAIHHSQKFRDEYRPAYRVVANRYVEFLEVFTAIDESSECGEEQTPEYLGSDEKERMLPIFREVYGKE